MLTESFQQQVEITMECDAGAGYSSSQLFQICRTKSYYTCNQYATLEYRYYNEYCARFCYCLVTSHCGGCAREEDGGDEA
jgi:hypothetical protein